MPRPRVRRLRADAQEEQFHMLITNLISNIARTSLVEENPIEKRLKSLEKTIQDLKKEKGVKKTFSKADLIYYKFKDDLEKEHLGKIVAIDVDSEKIVGIGSSVLEAYSEAKKNTSRKQFSYRRVGFDFVHRL